MIKELRIQQLCGGTLFKIIFIGNSSFFIPYSVLMGVFSFFGIGTMKWNEHLITGFAGLVASPFLGGFMALLFTACIWVPTFIGLWLYSKFQPINLIYIPVSEIESNKTL